MPTVQSILEQIDELSPTERKKLRDLLIARTLGDPPGARSEDEWIEEIARRRSTQQERIPWAPGQRPFGDLTIED